MKYQPCLILFVVLTLCACNIAPTPESVSMPTPSPQQQNPTIVPDVESIENADIIFTNGTVFTMDDARPSVQAIAIQGNKILAVGTNEEVLAHQDDNTIVVDLEGRTVTPGFMDSHQHRIGDRGKRGYTNADPVVQLAIEQGWTTINELYVDEGRLNELRDLDQSGVLRLRVNAYLPVMENSPEGKSFGEWYAAYNPGQVMSPHVRVAGLKVFTDFDNATILLWQQEDLNAFLLREYRNGWQLAVKTVSTRSLEMILKAFESIEVAEPQVVNSRPRLEHALFLTPEQIARVKHLGLIPIINLNNPGQLVGEPDVDALIAREPQGSYTPWRSLVEAGIPIANGTGWPSFYVDEPSGAPFGSPMHLIYQAVTRVGNLGTQPYPWLLDQTITAEQALRALTIDAVYSSYEENVKGSLTPGKLADIVILSDNPLTVSSPEINNIRVLMTMIDGKVEYCAAGFEAVCPSVSSTQVTSEPDFFVGNWVSTDPADGSAMSLQITQTNGSYTVVLLDEKARACGQDASGNPKFGAEVTATGTVNGMILSTVVSSLKCLSEPPTFLEVSVTIDYTYQSATDTLVDNQGAIWSRR